MKPKLSRIPNLMPWLSIIILAVLTWYFLLMRNGDVLFMHQVRSLFCDTADFYQQFQTKPAGFLQWAGCYFTQFFYYPALGCAMLFLMWTAIFFIQKKALRIPDAISPMLLIPLVCLVASEIDLGYWLYYSKNPGYCFSQTIGMLIASVLMLIFRYAAEVKIRFGNVIAGVIGAVVIASLYRYIGAYALVALAVLCIAMLLERKWIAGAIYAVAVIFAPFMFQRVFDTLQSSDLYTAGIPVFQSGRIINSTLTNQFLIAIGSVVALTVVCRVGARLKTEKMTAIVSSLLTVIMAAGSFWVLDKAEYDDENYKVECEAYRAIDEQRWEDALYAIRQVEGPLSRQNILFKNIALFNTHDIGNSLFDYDSKGMVPSPDDSLLVHTANTCGPLIYLHHGMTNYAYRYCMEVQVDFGFNVGYLKVMAITSMINGETKLAKKYLDILSRTIFYKDWAEHYRPLAHNPKLISKYPEFANICELHSCIPNYYDSDEGICENFITNFFSKSHSETLKYFHEMCLVYSIIYKQMDRFWPRYLLYLKQHKGEPIPVVYQQAAYMFLDLAPESAPDPKTYGLEFDKEKVVDRYNQFDQETQGLLGMGLQEEAIAEQTKSSFGNTFWWSYYFVHGVMCY